MISLGLLIMSNQKSLLGDRYRNNWFEEPGAGLRHPAGDLVAIQHGLQRWARPPPFRADSPPLPLQGV